MAYEIEDIRMSQMIFYYLLQHHELRSDKEPEMYKAYTENEAVQIILSSQEQVANCIIERLGDVICLWPGIQNNFLGFSSAQLAQELCRNGGVVDQYLLRFAIWVLLLMFYHGEGSTSKQRDFIRLGDLTNAITEYLEKGAEKFEIDEQKQAGIAFSDMKEVFSSLRSSDDSKSRTKTTKEGFLSSMLRFLEDQGLIIFIREDDMIKTTKRLDYFMDYELLNKSNYQHVCEILRRVHEQD